MNQNFNSSNLQNKTIEELKAISEALKDLSDRRKYYKLDFMYPEEGPFRKSLYPKHMEFMEAGAHHLIRGFFAGNGVGKTVCGGTEFTYHLTGKYPKDFKGRKFTKPIKAWACGIDNKQLRAGIQEILFGDFSDMGTGLIPKEDLTDDKGFIQTWAMAGTANCIGTARIKHYTNGVFDGWSTVEFKTYAQGWQEVQGATRDLIWLDEEPTDPKFWSECVARTRGPAGKEGSIFITFTPLLGYTTLYLSFMPNGQVPPNGIHPDNEQRHVTLATWKDCPHLSEAWKKSAIEDWKLSDPNSIESRINGTAAVGSGRIYPIDESFVIVPQFQIPSYWPKAYGLDPGWTNTAAVWIAEDPNTKIKYIYSEYKHGKVLYLIHADAIKNKGEWIPGAIDPHEARKPRDDGSTVQDYFMSLGLELYSDKCDGHAMRARIYGMYESGALKIMDNCTGLINEIRTYRYDMDDPNRPAEGQDDHRCDAKMYCLSMFDKIAKSFAEIEEERSREKYRRNDDDYGDSQRSEITGY
jgi:phage terminase large subunit-like protein